MCSLSRGAIPNVIRSVLEYLSLKYGPATAEREALRSIERIVSPSGDTPIFEDRRPSDHPDAQKRPKETTATDEQNEQNEPTEKVAVIKCTPFKSRMGTNWADLSDDEDDDFIVQKK